MSRLAARPLFCCRSRRSRSSGMALARASNCGAQVFKLIQVFVGKRVLELRGAATAADLMSCCTWRKSVAPGTLVSFLRRRLTPGRLRRGRAPGPSGLSAIIHVADVSNRRLQVRRRPQRPSPKHGWIVEHHLRQLALLEAHGVELMSCAARVRPPMRRCSCCGKKPWAR